MAKKRQVKAGEQVPFRLKKYESPVVLEWINQQANVADSLRYIIEMDYYRNGGVAINYQSMIATDRDANYCLKMLTIEREAILRNSDIGQTAEELKFGHFALPKVAIPTQEFGRNEQGTNPINSSGAPNFTEKNNGYPEPSAAPVDSEEPIKEPALSADEMPEVEPQEKVEDVPTSVSESKEEPPQKTDEEKRLERQRRREEREKQQLAALEKESITVSSNYPKVKNSKNLTKEQLEELEKQALEGATDW